MPYLIRKPTLRLPREGVERHATWLEIFFDLIFSILVVRISASLLLNISYIEVLKGAALFIPIMWTWASYTVFAARFDNNDFYHWLMTFLLMFAGVIMALQIPRAFDSGATVFSLGFLLGQIVLLLLYTRIIFDNTTPKDMKLLYLFGFGTAGICWAISLFFESPLKFVFWAIGMCIYLLIPWIGKRKILSKAPLDNIYLPERFGAFTIIILGQIIASVVFGLDSTSWHLAAMITSIMAFVLALLIWVQYYRFTLVSEYKCSIGSGQPYIYTHIPLIISLIFIGVCVEDSIKNSTQVNPTVHVIFYFAILLYLSSFYLLQFISFYNFKVRGVSFILSIIAISLLFFLYPMPPVWTISGLVFIFACLFAFQFWLGTRIRNEINF